MSQDWKYSDSNLWPPGNTFVCCSVWPLTPTNTCDFYGSHLDSYFSLCLYLKGNWINFSPDYKNRWWGDCSFIFVLQETGVPPFVLHCRKGPITAELGSSYSVSMQISYTLLQYTTLIIRSLGQIFCTRFSHTYYCS